MPSSEQRAEIVGTQAMRPRQQQFGRDHILADQAHMIPRRDGFENLDRPSIDLVYFLDHDDGVSPSGQRIAGVDILEGAGGG